MLFGLVEKDIVGREQRETEKHQEEMIRSGETQAHSAQATPAPEQQCGQRKPVCDRDLGWYSIKLKLNRVPG